MRISDWSSDVCSSDLLVERTKPHRGPVLSDFRAPPFFSYRTYHSFCIRTIANFSSFGANSRFVSPGRYGTDQIGRAHVCTPVPNVQLVCRPLIAKKNTSDDIPHVHRSP